MAETVHNVASSWSGTSDSANGDRVNLSVAHRAVVVTHAGASGTVTVEGTVLDPGESVTVVLRSNKTLVVAEDSNGFPFETADPDETVAEGVDSWDFDTADNGVSITSSANLAVSVVGA
jgi:hypothetical protein